MEEQPETWRRHDEVDKPPSAICGHVAEWSPGFTEHFISPPCPIIVWPIDFFIHFKVFALNPGISLFWQHGQGTHFWNTSQGEGGHFFLSSRYSGEFVQGQRHGHGKVCFASGATYVGEWKHDKNQEKVQLLQSGLFKVWMPTTNVSVPQGKFTSADGRVFEGDRVYDQMMAQCLNSNRDLNPLSGKAQQQFEYAPLSQPGRRFRSAFSPCFYTRPDAEH